MKLNRIKYGIIILFSLIISITVCGCGLGEKTEERLFNAMKDNGLLSLNCKFEDYTEIRTVDQSPIPRVIKYYDYQDGDTLYTIDYDSRILSENDSVYQVRLTTKTEENSETSIYYFEKDTFKFREKK